MRIGIKENAWWNFMRNGVNGEHNWVYRLGESPTWLVFDFWLHHSVPPAKNYIPNPENLQTFDQFLDLFDNEAMDFYDLSLHQNYVNNITALAPINMLTAPIDFWYGFWQVTNLFVNYFRCLNQSKGICCTHHWPMPVSTHRPIYSIRRTSSTKSSPTPSLLPFCEIQLIGSTRTGSSSTRPMTESHFIRL